MRWMIFTPNPQLLFDTFFSMVASVISWTLLRLSKGALLPTVTSARTWDYEVQSENFGNPQLEEFHRRNNKKITKDHFNKRVRFRYTRFPKLEKWSQSTYLYGFAIQEFGNYVLSSEHKLLAVVVCARTILHFFHFKIKNSAWQMCKNQIKRRMRLCQRSSVLHRHVSSVIPVPVLYM